MKKNRKNKMRTRYLKAAVLIPIVSLGFLFAHSTVAADAIYISQVQITGGKNNTGQDFVELFNPNNDRINLKGYRLVKRTGDGQSDILMKSWSKDIFIPPKSFFLWANSGFVSIAAKPDAISSATLAENNGVALRFGGTNTGQLIDSIAWGKTNNGFINVSSINPGANQAVIRKDFFSEESGYTIGPSHPRNSLVNDLSAAFFDSQAPPAKIPAPNPSSSPKTISTPSQSIGQVAGETSLTPEAVDVVATTSPEPTPNPKTGEAKGFAAASRYLALAGAALLALGSLVYWSFFRQKS